MPKIKYTLLKLVGDKWFVEGIYDNPERLAEAAFYLGRAGYDKIKFEKTGEVEIDV